MKIRVTFAVAATFLMTGPSWAGDVVVPTPEAGIGLGAMALLGGAYYLIKRSIRS